MDEAYWTMVTAMRHRVADHLGSLTSAEWDAPSLCEGWRVRDVAGHLSLVPTVTLGEMLAVAPRARFNPHRVNTLLAVQHGSLEPATILSRIQEHAADRRTATGLDQANALFDLVVHSQDLSMPLGRAVEVPVPASVSGLARVWEMGWPFHARRRHRHVTLRATDAEWTVGSGPEIRGPAVALLLLLTGRVEAATPRLEGPGLTRTGPPRTRGRRSR